MPPDILEKTDQHVDIDMPWEIVLYNDDFNAFIMVIICLMDICKHNADMASKIAKEAHEKGKAIA
ncbi:MAG: ATP-dependent Clp protease adaptor ClpS, partial [Actinobacteria bacterium]|nr:ATP-dependent Clp protease adaptor ClpS [Actinomycetota bacterium]